LKREFRTQPPQKKNEKTRADSTTRQKGKKIKSIFQLRGPKNDAPRKEKKEKKKKIGIGQGF